MKIAFAKRSGTLLLFARLIWAVGTWAKQDRRGLQGRLLYGSPSPVSQRGDVSERASRSGKANAPYAHLADK